MVNVNPTFYINQIRESLLSGTYKTSPYVVETAIKGKKERTIHKLPYFPDRIVHHAIVRVCKDFWVKSFIRDTFQSIEGRGTTDCFRRVKKAIKTHKPRYAIKLDIRKFYPSIDTKTLIKLNPFKITCPKTYALLSEILLSLPCLPLGNHTSQFAGNLFLNRFDWKCKQELKIKHYFRYCDDLVLMSSDKVELLAWVSNISNSLSALGLQLKPHHGIIDLSVGYLDFVGFRISHDKVLLRKSIAQDFKTACSRDKLTALPSYWGWCKHANARRLYHTHVRKITHEHKFKRAVA